MTTEQFEAKQQSMSDKELIENVKKQISELANTGGRSHRMCVPPQVTDTDMLLGELVRQINMKREQNLQEPQKQALNIPVVKNCTTCKFTGHRYIEKKCSKCSREYSMWKQR